MLSETKHPLKIVLHQNSYIVADWGEKEKSRTFIRLLLIPYFLFLLVMILPSACNHKRAIELFPQDHARHLVGEGEGGEGKF